MLVEYRTAYGYEGYRVGSDGTVWRLQNHEWIICKPYKNSNGYLRVYIYIGPNKRNRAVHSLIATAFHGFCPIGMQCRHLDGDKNNNSAGNLAWGTPMENTQDKFLHKNMKRKEISPPKEAHRGERVKSAKLNAKTVSEIRTLAANGTARKELSKRYGVNIRTIEYVVQRKSWKHVS